MKTGKLPFLVGRRTRAGTVVVLVERSRAPIQGPWTLEAVVTLPHASRPAPPPKRAA